MINISICFAFFIRRNNQTCAHIKSSNRLSCVRSREKHLETSKSVHNFYSRSYSTITAHIYTEMYAYVPYSASCTHKYTVKYVISISIYIRATIHRTHMSKYIFIFVYCLCFILFFLSSAVDHPFATL